MPTLRMEKSHQGLVAGMDEAGRGPWAGPVVAACVLFHKRPPKGIDDSKRLTAAAREQLFDAICNAAHFSIAQASVEEIDQLNILGATKLAMQRAFESMPRRPDTVLVDGNQPPVLSCNTIPVIKGDSLSLSIAAASILAKVARDRIMRALAAQYPFYAWERNAGYGTRAHQDGLDRHGVCPEHRTSFAPIRLIIEQRVA